MHVLLEYVSKYGIKVLMDVVKWRLLDNVCALLLLILNFVINRTLIVVGGYALCLGV